MDIEITELVGMTGTATKTSADGFLLLFADAG